MPKSLGRPLRVLFVTAEVAPFSSVGGLSQVSHYLPEALLKNDVDIRLFTPKYGTIDEAKYPMTTIVPKLNVKTGEGPESDYPSTLICNVKTFAKSKPKSPKAYFLENREYYEQRSNVYGYTDDHIRWALLSRGALEFIKRGDFIPDIIHANDWHSAYLVNMLKTEAETNAKMAKIATVLSIHNTYQGNFDYSHASDMDFDDGKSLLAPFFSDQFVRQNPLRRGIMYADVVSTVSETYAQELLHEDYGNGLENLLRELRVKLFGILNGLDYVHFNPKTDRAIKQNYSLKQLRGRRANKLDLQKTFGLPKSLHTPILAICGRLDWQKGLDLVVKTAPFILDELGVQLIVMGPGDQQYIDFFAQLEKDYPKQVATHLMADFTLPRKIFAGADMILMPSRYEPGGIVAIEAMRYGAVPVVRATGGLADIVTNYHTKTGRGTGFTFNKFAPEGFLLAVVRAVEAYQDQARWLGLVSQVMQKDFSWSAVATKYVDLYGRAMEFHKQTMSPISADLKSAILD